MKFIDVSQGSEEWHALRRTKIGASNAAAIVGKHPHKSSLDVWEEMVLGKVPFVNKAMKRGMDLEEPARIELILRHGTIYEPKVVQHPENEFMIASLDGYAMCPKEGSEYIVEIKCPGEKIYESAANAEIPEYWGWQIQHQLACTGLPYSSLFVYNGVEGIVLWITRNEDMIKTLIEKESEFYRNHILEFDPPKSESHFLEREDDEWSKKELEWIAAKKILDEASECEKTARQELIKLADERSCKGRKVSLRKYFKKGEVDYSQVESLKGISLEQWRKPPIEAWRIHEITP